MEINLISYTQDAKELLLWTKNTRLQADPGGLDTIRAWSEEKKQKELNYMLGTIQSSWEFINYVFSIQGVSRAFTHQLVRHRHASFAQQSQRTVDMSNFNYYVPENFERKGMEYYLDTYEEVMGYLQVKYYELIEEKAKPQDARGILPTNILTNIIMGVNLRTLSEMMRLRLCTRTQGETQKVFRAIREATLNVHEWAEPFLRVHCAATGICCFPNYTECPIKQELKFLQPDPIDITLIQGTWEETNFEATPNESK